MKAAELLSSRADEFGRVETLDNGKPIFEAAKIDMPAAADCLSYFGESADKLYGDTYPGRPDAMLLTLREPVGVIGAITPWNFPLLQAMWKIAPALALGNTVVLKPASATPLTALLFAELLAQAGLPPGAFNVVPGPGAAVGAAMAEHPGNRQDLLHGRDRPRARRSCGPRPARSNASRWSSAGSLPTSSSPTRTWTPPRAERSTRSSTARGSSARPGRASSSRSPPTTRSWRRSSSARRSSSRPIRWTPRPASAALVSEAQRDNVERYVESGKKEGAKLLAGGNRVSIGGKGAFFEATVFDAVSPDMTIAREEIFGPVLAAMTFRDENEAIAIGNSTIYGLAAAVWSRDVKKALRAARALKAGTVWINAYNLYDPGLPFGGYKQSGFGRERGHYALEEYTQVKSVWVDLT